MDDVIIIGAGASGLTAAIAARQAGAEVTVLEKNSEFGKKLLGTGNGRCNFTNLRMDAECFHSQDIERAMEVIKAYDQASVLDFISSLGIGIEYRDGWCYPRSMSAHCIVQSVLSHIRKLGISLKGNKVVSDIKQKDGYFEVIADGYAYTAKKVVLACGGYAAPKTGSTGEGFYILKRAGIRIRKPLPALVPLVIKDNPLKKANGVRMPAKVTLLIDGNVAASDTGNLQITEYGISGIPVFQISSLAVRALDEGRRANVKVDFFPDYPPNAVKSIVSQCISEAKETLSPDDPARYLLMGIFPEKLAEVYTDMIALDELTIGEADAFTLSYLTDKVLGTLLLEVSGSKGFDYAQTTSGGVIFDELGHDLSLKKIPGIYICGEEIDVDGICGGYNLQWAFSSGHLAGESAAKA